MKCRSRSLNISKGMYEKYLESVSWLNTKQERPSISGVGTLLDTKRYFESMMDQPINLLEIGVRNGGSLELWAEYFNKAVNIVGCDIDEACAAPEL